MENTSNDVGRKAIKNAQLIDCGVQPEFRLTRLSINFREHILLWSIDGCGSISLPLCGFPSFAERNKRSHSRMSFFQHDISAHHRVN